MSRVLRALMLLVSFATLQFSLARGGLGCSLDAADSSSSARGAMPGPGQSAPGMTGMATDGTATSGDATAGTESAPCDESAAPVSCPTTAPCAFAALPPLVSGDATVKVAPPAGPGALRVIMPPSVSAAPELPPPRA